MNYTNKKIKKIKKKASFHARNRHTERYDLKKLTASHSPLQEFIFTNKYDDETIDFSNADAVKSLNTALLKHYYNIKYWDIPTGYLCPPIPGRAEYVHQIAELIKSKENDNVEDKTHCLDIGVGANCIYPLIGVHEYGWNFTGTEIDEIALENANKIIEENGLTKDISLRQQNDDSLIFEGIIRKDEFFDVTICNPPFHTSQQDAEASSLRKLSNLNKKKTTTVNLNFGGQPKELWYDGGEVNFIEKMIHESLDYKNSIGWFTTLVSKQSNLSIIYKTLKRANPKSIKVIPMGKGNKISRILAWSFIK